MITLQKGIFFHYEPEGMHQKHTFILFMKYFFVFSFALLLWSCTSLPGRYVALDDHASLSFDAVLDQIKEERVIFVGELHGTGSSHRVQLEVIKYLHKSDKRVAIALEMFPSDKQHILDRWTKRYLSDKRFKLYFYETWGISYRYYRDIFEYARNKSIPLIGINADEALIGRVSKNGIQTVSKDLLKEIEFAGCRKDAEYAQLFGFAGKRRYHTAGMPFLCDGQRLRDAIMAYNIAQLLRDNNYTVVVLVGVAHASKVAVPRMLENHLVVSSIVILPDDIKYLIKRNPDKRVADYIWY